MTEQLTDVEISRALNALSITMRDQRPARFEVARAEEIVRGALAGEEKIEARASGQGGELRKRDDHRLLATVSLEHGQWVVTRCTRAGESSRAIPQPEHDAQAKSG
jgi:hypothetical protein